MLWLSPPSLRQIHLMTLLLLVPMKLHLTTQRPIQLHLATRWPAQLHLTTQWPTQPEATPLALRVKTSEELRAAVALGIDGLKDEEVAVTDLTLLTGG